MSELMVRELPVSERPVRRLRDSGSRALSLRELLACILQTPNALNQADQLIVQFENLGGLVKASEAEITAVDGIGPAQAARLKAALELGTRLMLEGYTDKFCVRSPQDVAQLLTAEMGHLQQEHFVVLMLDTRNRVLGQHTAYIGTLNSTHIRVGEIFREAIRQNAAAIIIAHNHPSGDPTPSPEDVEVTRQIHAAGDMIDIELLDHMIICAGRYISLKERGLGFS